MNNTKIWLSIPPSQKFYLMFSSLFRCEGKENCYIQPGLQLFGDPCPGIVTSIFVCPRNLMDKTLDRKLIKPNFPFFILSFPFFEGKREGSFAGGECPISLKMSNCYDHSKFSPKIELNRSSNEILKW